MGSKMLLQESGTQGRGQQESGGGRSERLQLQENFIHWGAGGESPHLEPDTYSLILATQQTLTALKK